MTCLVSYSGILKMFKVFYLQLFRQHFMSRKTQGFEPNLLLRHSLVHWYLRRASLALVFSL